MVSKKKKKKKKKLRKQPCPISTKAVSAIFFYSNIPLFKGLAFQPISAPIFVKYGYLHAPCPYECFA